ncbi:glycoside hydrolase family 47 protein [Sporobolomyces salmoneus]|uniref:glycoside hydrolase family 47 protein n=1 Tax=Sporobolomyces salmoneus TaxID=183962 RepID=UPI00316C9294
MATRRRVKPATNGSPSASPANRQTPPRRKPSVFKLVTSLGRIGICIAALYVLYKRYTTEEVSTSVPAVEETFEPIEADLHRSNLVLEALQESYRAYEEHAFGFDDFHPISKTGSNMSPKGPIGYFLIDSLDSLWIAGMKDEFQRARDWVATELDFSKLDDKYHTFEITIRVLGGLLSAYHLSGEQDVMLLNKAVDLADRLLPAFETKSGLPLSFVNLAQQKGIPDEDNYGLISVAEAGTLQLEFKYLSELTGNPVYWEKVEHQDHLVCFLSASLLLGASTSSSLSNPLALPPLEDEFSDSNQDDWYLGKELLRTCVDTYFSSKTGLAPEIVNFYTPRGSPSVSASEPSNREWFINSRQLTAPEPPIDARNILRPETAESLFVAYRVTGDPIYREWGWRIFEAFKKHCRLEEGGFASIRDVDQVPAQHEDRMETFWISETLKYLLLLFSGPEVLPLDKFVFNTEAHPLPVFTPTVPRSS